MIKYKTLFAVIVSLAIVSSAVAAPLAPPISLTNPTAGQTTLLSAWDSSTTVGYVDWMVLPGGNYQNTDFAPLVNMAFGATTVPQGQYFFSYKLLSLIEGGEVFSVNVVDTANVIVAGTAPLDLATVGHDVANFPNLGPPPPVKFEFPVNLPLVPIFSFGFEADNNISWRYQGTLDDGEETEVMWFVSDVIPAYRPASYQNDVPPSPGLGDVASVIPAPGAVLLGMIGLGLINWIRRRFA